ncbi:hypothetical protein D3C76_1187300 [compost metagenome]
MANSFDDRATCVMTCLSSWFLSVISRLVPITCFVIPEASRSILVSLSIILLKDWFNLFMEPVSLARPVKSPWAIRAVTISISSKDDVSALSITRERG